MPGDFDVFAFTHGGTARPVFTRGDGPAVIVCHEIAGLSPSSVGLARRIADEGFTVFAPALFGTPGRASAFRGLAHVCLSREFTTLKLGRTSPVSDWIRALARVAEERTGVPGVAAIGMCVTGGIVIPVLLSDSVRAAVASQPSLPAALPFCSRRRRRDLGMSDDDLRKVQATGKPVLALRFTEDKICPRERVERIDDEIAGPPAPDLPSKKPRDHSVLTYPPVQDPAHPSNVAFDLVVDFLHEHLTAAPT